MLTVNVYLSSAAEGIKMQPKKMIKSEKMRNPLQPHFPIKTNWKKKHPTTQGCVSVVLNWRWFCPPGDIWQSGDIFGCNIGGWGSVAVIQWVETQGCGLTTYDTRYCTAIPDNRTAKNDPPQMSTVLRLRNPGSFLTVRRGWQSFDNSCSCGHSEYIQRSRPSTLPT